MLEPRIKRLALATHAVRLPRVVLLACAAMLIPVAACGDDTEAPLPFEYPTLCQVGQDTRPLAELRLVDAFPTLKFQLPIAMSHANDGSGRLFLAERAGRIRVIYPGASGAAPSIVESLDFTGQIYTNSECGFLGLALHPRHTETGTLYTNYCIRRNSQTFSVISEWTVRADDPDIVDPDSERVLLELRQPFDNHNGGALAFGPDGFLYASFGDGGSGNDPNNAGQDQQTLHGKILRIDVDDPGTEARPYGIPTDNPYADGSDGRPEIYAVGLRNPWRMSFDRETGELWVADVGQDLVEEVNIVELGKNYGWRVMEGTSCRPNGPPDCDKAGLALPVLEYPRSLGRSITGGYVYRGSATPSLTGRYVFADYTSRGLFVWQKGDPNPTKSTMTTPGSVGSFGEDEEGEIYLLELETGIIRRFEEGIGTPVLPPPARLSETGCFQDLANMVVVDGILPYAPRWSFWSDGADKSRWVVMPVGGKMVPTDPTEGPWRFPVGTVYIKHFEIAEASGDIRRLETRFLIQEDLGVRGFTYRWNDAGTDALLLDDSQRTPVTTEAGTFDWQFPSPGECVTCHRGGGVLGLDGYQLDTEARDWARMGLLSAKAPAVVLHPTPESTASTEAKARAFLDVNCGYCHDSGGPSGTPLDLRRATPLAATEACDKAPIRGAAGVEPASEARLIAPGLPDSSVVYVRALHRDALTMPPIGSAIPDPSLDILRDWIAGLESCE